MRGRRPSWGSRAALLLVAALLAAPAAQASSATTFISSYSCRQLPLSLNGFLYRLDDRYSCEEKIPNRTLQYDTLVRHHWVDLNLTVPLSIVGGGIRENGSTLLLYETIGDTNMTLRFYPVNPGLVQVPWTEGRRRAALTFSRDFGPFSVETFWDGRYAYAILPVTYPALRVDRYDPEQDVWSTMDWTVPGLGPVTWIHGRGYLVTQGYDASAPAQLYAIDTANGTVTRIDAQLPVASQFAAAALGGRLFMFDWSGDVFVYDTANATLIHDATHTPAKYTPVRAVSVGPCTIYFLTIHGKRPPIWTYVKYSTCNGGPVSDTDGDTVPDTQDHCPGVDDRQPACWRTYRPTAPANNGTTPQPPAPADPQDDGAPSALAADPGDPADAVETLQPSAPAPDNAARPEARLDSSPHQNTPGLSTAMLLLGIGTAVLARRRDLRG